jgi:NAD(P)-dependent dehydrogenase (short-subunit alcohol dehydrogenase family)
MRTTLITGSRSGIGRALADLLRSRGETVIGLDVADAQVVADLSDAAGRSHAVDGVRMLCLGGLDAIVACAGVAIQDGRRTVAVNYFGVVDVIEPLLPLVAKSATPRVVVIASSANMLTTNPALVQACLDHDEELALELAGGDPTAYASSKLALTRWVRRTAVAPGWADKGVLLNGIAPGLVHTPMIEPMLAVEEARALVLRSAPYATPAMIRPDDVAPLLAFLASSDNRAMLGQVPYCDAGSDVLLRGDNVLSPAPGFA